MVLEEKDEIIMASCSFVLILCVYAPGYGVDLKMRKGGRWGATEGCVRCNRMIKATEG